MILAFDSIGLYVLANQDRPAPSQVTNPLPEIFQRLKSIAQWRYEYFNGTHWLNKNPLLKVIRTYPQPDTCKIGLNFTTQEAGAYRLTLAINQKVRSYINKTAQAQYNLTYEGYSLIFDWNDLLALPNLILKHGFSKGFFWFRIRKNSLSANKNYLFDPSLIVFTGTFWATRHENQYKTFRNSGGLQYCYALIYQHSVSKLRFFRSENGTSWSLEADIKTINVNVYADSSLWSYHNGTGVLVYFVWCEDETGNEGIYYRRGYIDDANYTIALNSEQTIVDNAGLYSYVVISITDNGYLSVVARRIDGGSWSLGVDGYNQIVCDWTKVGSTPFLHDFSSYIYTSGKNDDIYEFSFENMTRPDQPTTTNLTFSCKREDDNDYFSAHLYNGSVWSNPYDFYPTSTLYHYVTVDVTSFLDTNEKLNNAKLRIVKRSVGASNLIHIRLAKLDVETTLSGKIVSYGSTVPYAPSASNWTSETTVFDSSGQPTLIPLFSESDFCIAWRYSANVSLCMANFSGSSFTFGVTHNSSIPNLGWLKEVIRLVEDSNQTIHILAVNSSRPYYNNFSSGVFNNWVEVVGVNIQSASMSIDSTATPNQIMIIYGWTSLIAYKNQTVGNVDFSSATQYNITLFSAPLDISASYRDMGRKCQVVYIESNNAYWLDVTTSYAPSIEEDDLIFILFFGACCLAVVLLGLRKKRK